jgi:thymidylate synthase ThyX
MQSVKLIGVDGKFTKAFSEEIAKKKKDGIIDEVCYTGTPYENLCEYAGRICYRSGYAGKNNRSSHAYHVHIKDYNHHSIYGHSNLTFTFDNVRRYQEVLIFLAGIPGWYPNDYNYDGGTMAITFNARLMHNIFYKYKLKIKHEPVMQTVAHYFQENFPFIFPKEEFKVLPGVRLESVRSGLAPVHRWYSFQITTSRRVAQELTRHGFQSAVSGESTRFVDVQDNELIFHPDFTMDEQDLQTMHKAVKDRYVRVFEATYKKLVKEGHPESYCKKQARGAAAEVMPLALSSTMIFSCTETELNEILTQRLAESADRLIQLLAKDMREVVEAT